MGTSREYVSKPRSHSGYSLAYSQANILIGRNGRARLADFSLLTIVSDQSTVISSCIEGGTIQWMSPELIDPESFGLEKTRPTKESDCYALGMVIYEVLSGRTPFAPWRAPLVIQKVLQGERPRRPEGDEGILFTDDLWGMLELCWKHEPGERVSAKDALPFLEGTSPAPQSPSDANGIVREDTDERSDATASDSGMFSGMFSVSYYVSQAHLQSSSGTVGPSATRGLPVSPDDSELLASPQRGSSRGGWVGWLARSTRGVFKVVARGFCGV